MTEEICSRSRNLSAPRRRWSLVETRTLLVCVYARREEFYHVEKKKHVHDNLVEDMTNAGVSDTPFSSDEIRNKLKALKTAYKAAIDNNNRTGAAPSVAPFMDLLDEIYGYSNLGPEATTSVTSTSSVGVARRDTNPPIEQQLADQNFEQMIEISIPEVAAGMSSNTENENIPTVNRRRPRRISKRENYFERKLQLKEKALKITERNKFKRFRLKEAAKQQRHIELLAALREGN